MKDQGVDPYEHFSSLFREIVLHPFFKKGNDLTPQKMEMFHMVFYNLDKFREFIFESSFLKRFDIAQITLEAIKKNDIALMEFGVDWLKFCLFGENTIKLKGELSEEAVSGT